MKIITKLIDDDGKVRKSGTIYVDKPQAWSLLEFVGIVQNIMQTRDKITLKELYKLYLTTDVQYHVSKKAFSEMVVSLGYAKWCGYSNVKYISKEQPSSIQTLSSNQIQEFVKSYIEEHGTHGKVVANHLFNAWQQNFRSEEIYGRRQFYAYLQSIGYTKKRGSGNKFYISGYKFREGSGT